jgi:[ribosomal protein S5]-alanine N-acetyltransferase
MTLIETQDSDIAVFKRLCTGDRLERMTCRPIQHGMPLPRDERHERWTFVLDGAPTGWVTLFDFNSRNRSVEFGYGVIPAARGRGIGRRMLVSAFDRFFQRPALSKLHCQTASFNLSSVRLLESLKLTRDAVLRQHHELDGKLYDDYIYSILRNEWYAGLPS